MTYFMSIITSLSEFFIYCVTPLCCQYVCKIVTQKFGASQKCRGNCLKKLVPQLIYKFWPNNLTQNIGAKTFSNAKLGAKYFG